MERIKFSKVGNVNLVEPLTWHGKDGTLRNVKRFSANGFIIIERDGQCYTVLNTKGFYYPEGILFAIKEKFDDLEGEEIKAGGNASETEE